MPNRVSPIRIVVTLNHVEGYARSVLRGITSFGLARNWECHIHGLNMPAPLEPVGPITGLIAQIDTPETLTRIQELALPTVNVSSALNLPDTASVVSDNLQVGRMGAEYFLRRGFRNFLFFSSVQSQYALLRKEGFATRLEDAGIKAALANDRATLAALLFDLPKSLAVMCCNDSAALAVLDQCRIDHLRVPDDVAVLGVDNDDLIQSLASPPLSSIKTAAARIGFEAAALLERLIKGETDKVHLLIPPVEVVTRESTDLLAVADREVADAVRFIRDHAGSPIGVDDVLRIVSISRRQLERRFKTALGRSMLEEIRRCRVDRAKQLLAETDLTIPQIALATGFSTASYLTVVFEQEIGVAPGAFRKQQKKI